MTLRQLNIHTKAHEKKLKEQQLMNDLNAWNNNQYTLMAVTVALDKLFNGEKAKSEYPDKPFTLEEREKTIEEMTDSELEEKIELAIMKEDMWLNGLNNNKALPQTIL